MQDADCIFCKIIKGEIPSTKVYEDESFFSFIDIKPVSPGHLLIIPKTHVVWMQEADDEIIKNMFVLAKKLMLTLKESMGCDFVQMSVVGKEVPHFHVHLIPRYNDDGIPPLASKKYEEGEMQEIAEKIVKAL